MTHHATGTREEWLTARLELLKAEKALTRRSDEVARQRQELPWVRIDKQYRFETDAGTASLTDLFSGRSQLLIYHFMFGPDYTAGCPSCSAIADGFNGSVVHLANHDVAFCAVSRAPLAKLQTYKRRMGWSFPWASSFGTDFNHDFQAAHTKEEWESGAVEYNFRTADLRPPAGDDGSGLDEFASSIVGTDWQTYRREGPRVRARARRPLGHVPVARPGAARPQRSRPLVAPSRRVPQRVTGNLPRSRAPEQDHAAAQPGPGSRNSAIASRSRACTRRSRPARDHDRAARGRPVARPRRIARPGLT